LIYRIAAPRERPRLQLAKRTVPAEEAAESVEEKPQASSAIFGGAKPVDTARKEREIEEKLKSVAPKEPEPPKKPTATDIFGAAKPVDTSKREREIEERLKKKQEEEEANRKDDDKDDRNG